MIEQEPHPEDINNEFESMEGAFFIERLDTARIVLSAAFIAQNYMERNPSIPFLSPAHSKENQEKGGKYNIDIVPHLVSGLFMLHQQMHKDSMLEKNFMGEVSAEQKEQMDVIFDAIQVLQKHFKANPTHSIVAEVSPTEDVHQGQQVVFDMRNMMTLGLNAFFQYLHSDLADMGKNKEAEEIARMVFEKYRPEAYRKKMEEMGDG